MDMMQKMMAMMSGQIPMDMNALKFDPSTFGNMDPSIMASMSGMMNTMQQTLYGNNEQGMMGQQPMISGGMGFEGDWGQGGFDPMMMEQQHMGPTMEDQIA